MNDITAVLPQLALFVCLHSIEHTSFEEYNILLSHLCSNFTITYILVYLICDVYQMVMTFRWSIFYICIVMMIKALGEVRCIMFINNLSLM